MKIIYVLFFFLLPLSSYASTKSVIKNKLENTNNIYFKFIQKINNKVEKGECKISYPKKIFCKYDNVFDKVIVSNGRSLIINSKKIKNYLNYKLKDTPLNLILDKNFLLKKIDEMDKIDENNENISFVWTYEGAVISDENSPSLSIFESGTYEVCLLYTSDAADE